MRSMISIRSEFFAQFSHAAMFDQRLMVISLQPLDKDLWVP